jgi:S-adenosylmethionine:tRNA ribosyltransferase-isomerase
VSSRNPASKEFLKGKCEALLVKHVGEWDWEALVRPGRKIRIGERLTFGSDSDTLQAEVIARGEFGERTLRFDPVPDFFACIERIGHVPLPPYIDRGDLASDHERYQTVYARERGSVAAPTAGLHFTPEILDRLRARNIQTAEVTLHVGLGTFQPVHEEVVEQHQLHREWYRVSPEAAETINRALLNKQRIVAIGTTAVRTLEYAGRSGEIEPGSGETGLFIYPGYEFQVVSAMLTNFHLPKSTLLMLVSALGGRDLILRAYTHAVEEKYRFYSYGDCMFVE